MHDYGDSAPERTLNDTSLPGREVVDVYGSSYRQVAMVARIDAPRRGRRSRFCLWNVLDDRVDWVAELARVSGSAAVGPRDTLSSWRAATAGLHLPNIGLVAQFGSPEQADFPHAQRRTADSLVATIATRAGLLVMPEQEREPTLDRIRAFLASRPETARGEFTLPMLTGVLRVRRL